MRLEGKRGNILETSATTFTTKVSLRDRLHVTKRMPYRNLSLLRKGRRKFRGVKVAIYNWKASTITPFLSCVLLSEQALKIWDLISERDCESCGFDAFSEDVGHDIRLTVTLADDPSSIWQLLNDRQDGVFGADVHLDARQTELVCRWFSALVLEWTKPTW